MQAERRPKHTSNGPDSNASNTDYRLQIRHGVMHSCSAHHNYHGYVEMNVWYENKKVKIFSLTCADVEIWCRDVHHKQKHYETWCHLDFFDFFFFFCPIPTQQL